MSLEMHLAVLRRMGAGGVTRSGFVAAPPRPSLPPRTPTPSLPGPGIPAEGPPQLGRIIESPYVPQVGAGAIAFEREVQER